MIGTIKDIDEACRFRQEVDTPWSYAWGVKRGKAATRVLVGPSKADSAWESFDTECKCAFQDPCNHGFQIQTKGPNGWR
jgi:hypothetical protein